MSAACTTSTFPSSPALATRPAAVPPAVRRGAWQLAAGEATSLRASKASILRIRQGRVWVTRDATAQWGSEDLVLAPGETLRVESGERIVMEPWDGQGATYSWDLASAADRA
ncbi:hypothetical protein H4CHR_01038 [Variovorax sp. PBS-H4]|uniref:DUF2917 domain-containing protein n=1 Tax=Variovorax sp. PBS-H4 TaxID=434008 RepID=UPI0013162EA5|nr:DUF2917 domain-containing protein [Variovorax sp. PBS-H4]VTU22683.1 hypothetical protein H4CHR_01038 [Variovorax sp. PBS-H4]